MTVITKQRPLSPRKWKNEKGTEDVKKVELVGHVSTRLPPYPHLMMANEACAIFQTIPEEGLTETQVERLRTEFGANVLAERKRKSIWTLLREQFEDLLVRILLAAALVSFILAVVNGESDGLTAFVEPLVILLILFANALVSIWQESNAEKSLEALKKLQPEVARVLRGREWKTVPAEDLVPGDIVEIRVGDRVPADLRILKILTTTLKVEESQLTGESSSVYKVADALPPSELDCEIQNKKNMLFCTTTISHGRAMGLVVATGMVSEIGIIQGAVVLAEEDEEPSPLQQKLDEFSQQLSKVIAAICVIVWLININHFSSHGSFAAGCIYYFKIAVALAVAAIPEGLPAVITTCLALGTKRMAKRHAIVRRLQSVETLGCTTVVCTDKTGTLTTNEMSAVYFAIPLTTNKLRKYSVEGYSFQPIGRIVELSDEDLHPGQSHKQFRYVTADAVCLQEFAKINTMCSEAKLELAGSSSTNIKRTGEPTEAALKVLVEKLGCPDQSLNAKALQRSQRSSAEVFCQYWEADYHQIAMLEFSRERKSMSVLVRRRGSLKNVMYAKGAPESILERSKYYMLPDGRVCQLEEEMRLVIYDEINKTTSNALRTLALAMRKDCGILSDYDGPSHHAHKQLMEPGNFIKFEQELIFVGLVGLLDPPRPEALSAVDMCKKAGIRVMMITGDNKLTAEAVGERCGISKELSFTGREFDMLDEVNKCRVLSDPRGVIFSRTEPRHKQLIVKLLRSLGEVVAMTGDGVNDAPALKQADIGIAMGQSGTEVAKEASAMILADDNFNTIVAAVEEGRSIYNNMKAFIRYLISSNIGEVMSIFLTAALGIPEGLAPVQLLWVNLVTDGLPATALGFNPPDVDVMEKPPRRKTDQLITPWVMFRYFTIGTYVGIATVGIFIHYYCYNYGASDGHTLISFNELRRFNECSKWNSFEATPVYDMRYEDSSCSFFTKGKKKASTLSLTVLVIIEMLNAFNALSEDHSLLVRRPWSNPSLVAAAAGSIFLHCIVLYYSPLASIFGVTPLDWSDWSLVIMWSIPVLFIDEFLKAIARLGTSKTASFFKYVREKRYKKN